jgi:hypothetical protein
MSLSEIELNVVSDADEPIPASHLPSALKMMTASDKPIPGHRMLVQRANDADIAPPLERLGRFWFCRRKHLPWLAVKLGLRLAEHPRSAA